MARVTEKDLQRLVDRLDQVSGEKGFRYQSYKGRKGGRYVGSGFVLDYAYGGVALAWSKAPSSGQWSMSSRMTRPQMYDYLQALIKGVGLKNDLARKKKRS